MAKTVQRFLFGERLGASETVTRRVPNVAVVLTTTDPPLFWPVRHPPVQWSDVKKKVSESAWLVAGRTPTNESAAIPTAFLNFNIAPTPTLQFGTKCAVSGFFLQVVDHRIK